MKTGIQSFAAIDSRLRGNDVCSAGGGYQASSASLKGVPNSTFLPPAVAFSDVNSPSTKVTSTSSPHELKKSAYPSSPINEVWVLSMAFSANNTVRAELSAAWHALYAARAV